MGEVLFNIEGKPENKDIRHLHREILSVMDKFYYDMLRVNLRKNTVCVLQCASHPECISYVYNWTEYLHVTSAIFIDQQKQLVEENLSAKNLLEIYQEGNDSYVFDAAYVKDGILSAMSFLTVFSDSEEGPLAYLMVHNSEREHLRKQIIEQYIYQNCDFFLYLNAKKNKYTMIDGNIKSVTLASKSDNYQGEIEKYVNTCIAPEYRKRAILEMGLANVIDQLEHQEVYTLYFDGIDPVRGYVRKRFEYRYYERTTQMLLLSCTDVTDIYLEEQSRRKALYEAMKSAKTDTLTGLLNYKGIVEGVSEDLEGKPRHAALLYMDLDNFKTVNDTLGHAVGDMVLCQVGMILYEQSFGDPMIGRIGGDEFIIYFPEIDSMDEVREYAQRVCEAVCDMEYGLAEGEEHVSCSIGIVEIPQCGTVYKDLVKKADDMLYCAKKTGKNKVCCRCNAD